jgi:hypothetical protein
MRKLLLVMGVLLFLALGTLEVLASRDLPETEAISLHGSTYLK